MKRRGWLTGNTVTATDFICRRLLIPNDLDLIIAVNGALLDLSYAYNWEQFGTATPAETAALMATMYQQYWESDACMIGAIMPYASEDPPPATLACDGATYARADYPKLYDVLLPGLIVDADNFMVPDLTAQFVFGADGTRTPLVTGGEEQHQLTIAEMPTHDHSTLPHSHTYNGTIPLVDALGAVPEPAVSGAPQITGAATVTVNATGGDGPHNNMPPFTALNYCIVAR